MNLAVFVSGRGSNLKALIDAEELKSLINIVAVVSNKSDCLAFEIAKKKSIDCFTVSNEVSSDSLFFTDLLEIFLEKKISLIVLAGFLKLIPAEFISSFEGKIINIHPALLPSFGGKGMFGMNVHKAVFNSSAKITGATVHFVDSIYDNGLIISQEAVDISDVDSYEEIAERVLNIEHKLLPFTVKKIAENKIVIINKRVKILD